jgi:hypothetical protein
MALLMRFTNSLTISSSNWKVSKRGTLKFSVAISLIQFFASDFSNDTTRVDATYPLPPESTFDNAAFQNSLVGLCQINQTTSGFVLFQPTKAQTICRREVGRRLLRNRLQCVSVGSESLPVGFPRKKRPFELTLSPEGFKNNIPWLLSSRIRNEGSIAVRRLGRRRVTRIQSATDPSLTRGKAGGGGSPENATDPSPVRDDERGRLTETARRGVEGVVIEKGLSKTFLFRLRA